MKKRLTDLLTWSQQYTRTDMHYLAKGSFWLSLGQGFRMLSGLALLVAFANLLPKETYGTYQYIMAAVGILSTFTLSGIGAAISRATAQGREGSLRYGFRVKLTWSIGMVFAAGAASLYYFHNENNTLGLSFLIVGALLPFLESLRLYRYYLRGKQLFRESELLGFGRQLIPLAAMLTALMLTDDVVVLLATYFASHTLAVGLVYIQVLRKYSPPYEEDADMLNLGKHLSFLNVLGMVATNLDKILIFQFLGAAPVAAYVLAQTPISHMKKVLAILTEMTIPKLSKRNFSTLQKTLPRKVWLFLFLTALMVAAYIVAAPFLFSIFFPTYPESILLTQVMALVILSYPKTAYSQAFKAHALKREIYLSSLSVPILTITLLLVLLPIYGVWGAVFATLLAHLANNLLIRYLFARAKVTTRPYSN